jgi:hypothetical protein
LDLLTPEHETTTLSQNISHQSYIAMTPHPEEQKPELHLHKSLKSCMLVIFCQEKRVVPFIARSKVAKTTLSVDSEYQIEIPSLVFKGELF